MDRKYVSYYYRTILILRGRFRWMDCQLQSLQRCATPVAVRKVLDDLPKSLEVHYARVLEGVDESNRDSVRSILRWVAFGLRPVRYFRSQLARQLDANHHRNSCPSPRLPELWLSTPATSAMSTPPSLTSISSSWTQTHSSIHSPVFSQHIATIKILLTIQTSTSS